MRSMPYSGTICNHIPSPAPTTSAPAAYGAVADFFDSPSRAPPPPATIYTGGEPFRPGPPPPPPPSGEAADFLYGGRSASDVQFVHYSSNGGGGGGGPAGAAHLNSPDSGIGDPNVTPSEFSARVLRIFLTFNSLSLAFVVLSS